eukprot:NODE_2468_length_929_cov_361.668192.p10 GENE.NODE_2468_length_929_cov_361.668192~~NODE_2468_length_929_cov_361.668192.p10  ORF type:complete len:52 (+),score=1.82 NODE_2468_length_929_cov_361.668192:209-364(+)
MISHKGLPAEACNVGFSWQTCEDGGPEVPSHRIEGAPPRRFLETLRGLQKG